jgi:mRNA interferase MazF
MTHYNRGDVVLVPFPFSDQTTTKKRPAVIISSNTYNDTSRDIVIMAITSQARGNIGIGEYMIELLQQFFLPLTHWQIERKSKFLKWTF